MTEKARRVVYAQGRPYGAPLVMVRGGATRDADVKAFLRGARFMWDGQLHAYKSYLLADEFTALLRELRDKLGVEIAPKDGLDPAYVLDI